MTSDTTQVAGEPEVTSEVPEVITEEITTEVIKKEVPEQKTKPTVAQDTEEPEEVPAEKDYWPVDWREKMAEHAAAGDQKSYKKELSRLKRFADPSGVYGFGREAENKLTSGNLIKIPGKDATEEDIASYNKARGVPESAEGYFENLELENGAVIGEADRPVLDGFAAKMLEAGADKNVMKTALDWYYGNLEEQAAVADQSDEDTRTESEVIMKEKYGARFTRQKNNIASLYQFAPNGKEFFDGLFDGRTADGGLIGNNAEFIDTLIALAHFVNPVGAVTESGQESGVAVDTEIKELEGRMKTDRRAYFKDEQAQARYRELVDARTQTQARKGA